MPFNFLQSFFVATVVYFSVVWLNAFPVKNGILDKISPRSIVVRTNSDFKKHWKLDVRTYCEVHDEPGPSNTMVAITHEAIDLGTTDNLNRSYKLFFFNTGRILKQLK